MYNEEDCRYFYSESVGMIKMPADDNPLMTSGWATSEDEAMIEYYKNKKDTILGKVKKHNDAIRVLERELNELNEQCSIILERNPEYLI